MDPTTNNDILTSPFQSSITLKLKVLPPIFSNLNMNEDTKDATEDLWLKEIPPNSPHGHKGFFVRLLEQETSMDSGISRT